MPHSPSRSQELSRILPIDISGALDAEIGQYEMCCFADVREALERPTEISRADRSGQPGQAVQGLEIEVPRVRLVSRSRLCFHRDFPPYLTNDPTITNLPTSLASRRLGSHDVRPLAYRRRGGVSILLLQPRAACGQAEWLTALMSWSFPAWTKQAISGGGRRASRNDAAERIPPLIWGWERERRRDD